MPSFSYLRVLPITQIPTQIDVDLVNSNKTGGLTVSLSNLLLPYSVLVNLPSNVTLVEILNEDAAFFPKHDLIHTVQTLEDIDRIKFLDTSSNQVIGIYSWCKNFVTLKCHFV